MKATFGIAYALVAVLATSAVAREQEEEHPWHVRATVELKDGSQLVGEPLEKSWPVTLEFTRAPIPLEKIRLCEVRHEDNSVVISLRNGDRITGTLELEKLDLVTVLGTLSPEIALIDRITFSSWREGNMPLGEGSLSFGGVNWQAWRTLFEIQGDKLMSLPKVRPGFNYGHDGNGRGPIVMSNIGNSDWKDYRLECDFCVTGVDPTFNPYNLGTDFHSGAILFHVADAKDSHNERGLSAYRFAIDGDGSWRLDCTYNDYCAQPIGWGNPRNDGTRSLASGRGLGVDRVNGNRYRIDIRGQRIQIWVDGRQIVDVTDEEMDDEIGGQRLDHGGVGFQGGFDAMMWIRNCSALQL